MGINPFTDRCNYNIMVVVVAYKQTHDRNNSHFGYLIKADCGLYCRSEPVALQQLDHFYNPWTSLLLLRALKKNKNFGISIPPFLLWSVNPEMLGSEHVEVQSHQFPARRCIGVETPTPQMSLRSHIWIKLFCYMIAVHLQWGLYLPGLSHLFWYSTWDNVSCYSMYTLVKIYK